MYLPYIADKRNFSTDRTDDILSGENIKCPKMTYDIFRKCIDYAAGSGWESKDE
ncbi:MAG: hypothetical protein JXN63_03465 [Candidatus Delongbacteria bacterium]|nr:hypothetical protein [Candidatus Delongbacteria bacterium]